MTVEGSVHDSLLPKLRAGRCQVAPARSPSGVRVHVDRHTHVCSGSARRGFRLQPSIPARWSGAQGKHAPRACTCRTRRVALAGPRACVRRLAPAAGLPPAGAAAQVRRSHRCRRSSLHVDERRSSKVRSYHRTRTRLERRRCARAPCSLLLPPVPRVRRSKTAVQRISSCFVRRAGGPGAALDPRRSVRDRRCSPCKSSSFAAPACARCVFVDSLQPHSSPVSYTPPLIVPSNL